MPTIRFPLLEVKKLVDDVRSSEELSVSTEDLFEPKNYPNNKIVNSEGLTEKECIEQGKGHFWPDHNAIDKSKLSPKLILVGDSGVYLINNRERSETPVSSGMIVYAAGCNPDKDEDCYENKVELFGGDDGSVSIPLDWFDMTVKKKMPIKVTDKFVIRLTSTQIKLVI